ncbi:YqaA family protein [Roseospirillum parvum]|uniref:Membrane protein YqaA, SNARE-associated domain n=1 Tax=Roseospirillum parvum TaxID=83401 RepID=A0A1G7Z625_9PROT|nr:YqaA family protein [Roseospirillum parvum]SDH04045.1 membrane protein YqaA, SNARE-associated domain [Roseospirillum parvum]
MLRATYDWTLRQAEHPKALWVLAVVAFVESSVFPIPPDVLLIPMVLAAPTRAFRIALVCTLGSVAGGFAGYLIGLGLFDTVGRWILDTYHASETFAELQAQYQEHGLLIVFAAGFSPIPYKVFTLTSGVMEMNPWAFGAASLLSRGARFFLVAALLWRFGTPMRGFIEAHLGKLTLAFVGLLVAGVVAARLLGGGNP